MPAPPQGYIAESVIPSHGGINILDYGADPTGTLDSYSAIQNSINAGKDVYVPTGTYRYNTGLVMKNGVRLRGDGINSVLQANFAGKGIDFSNVISWSLQDLYIQAIGSGITDANSIGLYCAGSAPLPCGRATMRNVYLDNWKAGKGFVVDPFCFEIRVYDMKAYAGTSLYYNNSFGPVRVENSIFQDAAGYGPAVIALVNLVAAHGTITFVGSQITPAIASVGLYDAGINAQLFGCYVGDGAGGTTQGIFLESTCDRFNMFGGSINGFGTGLRGIAGSKGILAGVDVSTNTTPVNNVSPTLLLYSLPGFSQGYGLPSLQGIDNRSGLVAADGSPITLYAVPTGAGQLFRITADIFATAVSAGTANYTITWTENAQAKTLVVSASVVNTLATGTDLINADASTNITAQLTFAGFTGTVKVAAVVEQLA